MALLNMSLLTLTFMLLQPHASGFRLARASVVNPWHLSRCLYLHLRSPGCSNMLKDYWGYRSVAASNLKRWETDEDLRVKGKAFEDVDLKTWGSGKLKNQPEEDLGVEGSAFKPGRVPGSVKGSLDAEQGLKAGKDADRAKQLQGKTKLVKTMPANVAAEVSSLSAPADPGKKSAKGLSDTRLKGKSGKFRNKLVKPLRKKEGAKASKRPNRERAKKTFDRVGAGLIKRPLDRIGSGLVKKDMGPKFEPHTSKTKHRGALGLILTGLDALESDLSHHGLGSGSIKRGFQDMREAAGHGDPEKELDVELVRRGLNRIGSGLTKREVDTQWLGLVKRGLKRLVVRVPGTAVTKRRQRKGMRLILEGLDSVGSQLTKNGFDEKGVRLIERGLEGLGAGLGIARPRSRQTPADKTATDRPEEKSKAENPFTKKTFDFVGSGLIKKTFDYVGSGLIKKTFDDVGSGLIKKNFDGVGSGLIKKTFDDVGSGLIKKTFDDVGSGLIKKTFDDVGSGLIKKTFDDVGSGLIKKTFDDVGSGLIKKTLDKAVSKEKTQKAQAKLTELAKKVVHTEPPTTDFDNKDSKSSKEELDKTASGLDKEKEEIAEKQSSKDFLEEEEDYTKKGLDYVGSGLIRRAPEDFEPGTTGAKTADWDVEFQKQLFFNNFFNANKNQKPQKGEGYLAKDISKNERQKLIKETLETGLVQKAL